MPFLLFAVGLVLIGAIAIMVALPLRATAQGSDAEAQATDGSAEREKTAEWEKQKADAYSAIKEAEFDRQMGKLSEEDYRFIREKYEARAVEALARLDALTKPPSG